MTSRRDEPIPPAQLFRTLLLHFLETHKLLTPFVRHTTNKELAWCHQQNAYILSEIGSWLADLTEDTDTTPSFSAADAAELLVGVASSLPSTAIPQTTTGSTPKAPAPPALPDLRRGFQRAASSQRRVVTRPPLERSSTGQILFRQRSSNEKLDSTSHTPENATPQIGVSLDYPVSPDSNANTDPLGG